MDYNIIIKPIAEEDIKVALDWYNEINKSLSKKLLEKIAISLEKIKENPEHYQKRYQEIRIVFTKKFPYGIYYTLENSTIYIHAILHTKQNPEIANERLK